MDTFLFTESQKPCCMNPSCDRMKGLITCRSCGQSCHTCRLGAAE